jgi:hypothetical protein
MISVHSRSSAESTNEAISERDDEKKTAPILAAKRRTLAITLIYSHEFSFNRRHKGLTLMAHRAFLAPFLRLVRSSSGRKASMSSPIFCSAPACSGRSKACFLKSNCDE